MRKQRLAGTFLLGCLALVGSVTGCAQEREPINRVQPMAMKKSFFVGEDLKETKDDPEFYSQATVLRANHGVAAGFSPGLFSNYTNELARIRWSIEQDSLIARLSYERIEGTSDPTRPFDASQEGQVIAAFRIQSHFDIRRSYNPATGEEQNVVEENASDRPWYEREFFRVDWSENLASSAYDFDTMAQVGLFNALKFEPVRYDIDQPDHPDAPVLDEARGYFDVTQKIFARPLEVTLPARLGGGTMPACFLPNEVSGGTAPSGNCNPIELTVRQAFLRVDPRTDFELVDYDGYRFQAAGFFTQDRRGYDRKLGLSDDKWHRFSQRYNIWERSHYYKDPAALTGEVRCFTPESTPVGADPGRDDDQDGTDDECAAVTAATGVGGSRCDRFAQKCTLPIRARTPRPIVFHYTDGGHPDFEETSAVAMQQWDVGMRATIMSLRYAECMQTEKNREVCLSRHPMFFGQQSDIDDAAALATEVDKCRHGEAYGGEDCAGLAARLGQQRGYDPGVVALARMDEQVHFCHSPVRASDAPACGAAGSRARQGDIRYHHINVIPQVQTGAPWGYGPSSSDPLTGETVSGRANVWSGQTELFAQTVVDRMRYIKGELAITDIAAEVSHVPSSARAAEGAKAQGALPMLSRDELDRKYIGGGAPLPPGKAAELRKAIEGDPRLSAGIEKLYTELSNTRADALAVSNQAPVYESRRVRALHTDTEAALMSQQWSEMSDGPQSDQAVRELSSPLRANNPTVMRDARMAQENALALRGADIHSAPSPTALTGLADIMEAKFGPFDPSASKADQEAHARRIAGYLAQRLHYSVVVHEVGHTFGLRHNFAGSADAWNYHPQYWQLRTRNGAVTEPCTELAEDGDSCVGPRYFDPVSETERSNLLWMWANSSIMEYPGEITQDFLGLSAYDYMALMMGYGDVVSVYDDPDFKAGTAKGAAVIQKTDSFGGILGVSYQKEGSGKPNEPRLQRIHYSQINGEYNLIRGCQQVDPQTFQPAGWNEARDGAWHPTLDGQIVQIDGVYSRCKQIPVDYVPWRAMRTASLDEAWASSEGQIRGIHQLDAGGRPRVPYVFGTDNWADLGNLSVYRHDSGADAYELMNFLITEPEVNHVFDSYRRGRAAFSVRGATARKLERYDEKIRDAAKGLGLFANIYKDLLLSLGYDAQQAWPVIAQQQFPDQILASGIAFDHFARQLARPQAGPHGLQTAGLQKDEVYRTTDSFGEVPQRFIIPTGATGKWAQVGIGGKLVENRLSDSHGEYDSSYTVNAGSYYEKAFTAILMAESKDNFISASRPDFVDARYRAVSLADLFPDGYRRWLASNLTGDDRLKGAWVYAPGKKPEVDDEGYIARPLGWTSWWTAQPEVCFPAENSTLCSALGSGDDLGGDTSAPVVPVDPQVGWEQQKQLIAFTLLYLPENQQQWWLDQLAIYDTGKGNDPGFSERVEFHDPQGRTYVARSIGRETIFGREVERGIGARVLEYANQLLDRAYVTESVDRDGDGKPDFIQAARDDQGRPIVKGSASCEGNPSCVALARYVSVPVFMRQALQDFGYASRLVGLF